jgi:hypothetical protein
MATFVDIGKLKQDGPVKNVATRARGGAELNQLKREFKPHQVLVFSIDCLCNRHRARYQLRNGPIGGRPEDWGLLIAYLMVGAVFVIAGLGEMAAFLPIAHEQGFWRIC